MYIHNLTLEFASLSSTESIDSAQSVATALYNDWHNIGSALVDVTTQKQCLAVLFPRRDKKEKEEKEEIRGHAYMQYQEQGGPRILIT
jgi:hypothetical protein